MSAYASMSAASARHRVQFAQIQGGRPKYVSPRPLLDRVTVACVAAGMAASFVATMSSIASTSEQFTRDYSVGVNVAQSATYYAAHSAQVLLITVAGVLALISTDFRKINGGYLAACILFLAAAIQMTARGYSFSDLLSTRLVDSTGPFSCLISMLVFAGCRRRNWVVLGPVIGTIAAVSAVLVLATIPRIQTGNRLEAVINMGPVLNVLFWTGAWVALRQYPPKSLLSRVRFAPMAVFALGSVVVQTRLNFVLLISLFGVFAFVQRRRRIPQAATWIVALAALAWIALFAAVCLVDTPVYDRLASSASALAGRLDDDSRTDQLRNFAENVPRGELVLGRGSFATWDWNGVTWRGGLDVGYLMLLLYGGLPLVITYIFVHIGPCVRVLRSRLTGLELTGAAMAILWSIVMLSSAYPGMTVQYYTVLLSIGSCLTPPQASKLRLPGARKHFSFD